MDRLSRAVVRLVDEVGHWTPGRWAAPTAGGGSRADLVYGLVQRLADLAADAESAPRREVPRLDTDLALPDQLRVIAADLVGAAPSAEVVTAALDAINATRRALGEPAPPRTRSR